MILNSALGLFLFAVLLGAFYFVLFCFFGGGGGVGGLWGFCLLVLLSVTVLIFFTLLLHAVSLGADSGREVVCQCRLSLSVREDWISIQIRLHDYAVCVVL